MVRDAARKALTTVLTTPWFSRYSACRGSSDTLQVRSTKGGDARLVGDAPQIFISCCLPHYSPHQRS